MHLYISLSLSLVADKDAAVKNETEAFTLVALRWKNKQLSLLEPDRYFYHAIATNLEVDAEAVIKIHKESIPEACEAVWQYNERDPADGCFVDGASTLTHTWFEDFRWNYSFCSMCLTHLGWHYQRGDERFFCLILDHLADTTKTEL